MPLRDMHSYKGHEMGTREDGKIVIPTYDRDFPTMAAAHAWVDGHVQREAKKSASSFSVLDLVKNTGDHRSAFNMRKAGGPYTGPRGGKWADSKHTIPFKEGTHASRQKKHAHAGGSVSKFGQMHGETDSDGHKDLAHRHHTMAAEARRDARNVRAGSNAEFQHKEESNYHSAVAIAHGHAASMKEYHYRDADPHNVKGLKDHLRSAAAAHQSLGDSAANAARNTPPTPVGDRSSASGAAASMGQTGSGKPMQYLSDRNFRDTAHGMDGEDHKHHVLEHAARAKHHDTGYTQSQREGDYAQASKQKRAADYHHEMVAAHTARQNGSTRAVRASSAHADHAAKMGHPGSMAGPFKAAKSDQAASPISGGYHPSITAQYGQGN